MAAQYAVYISALLTLWSVARQYPVSRILVLRDPGQPALGGWDLAP
jgi:hypothetical protein